MVRTPIVLIPLALAMSACSVQFDGNSVHEQIHRTLSSTGVHSIRVENIAGPVTIIASNVNNVTIDATKSAGGTGAIARTHVDIAREGDEIDVHTRYHREGGWFFDNSGASVAYDIRVPANLDVSVESVSGAVTMRGTSGDVRIEQVSGPVHAMVGRMSASRDVTISSVSGAIDVTMDRNSDVHLEGKTISGAIHAFFPTGVRKGMVGESLEGRLGSGSAALRLSAISGSITVAPE